MAPAEAERVEIVGTEDLCHPGWHGCARASAVLLDNTLGTSVPLQR